MPAYDLDELWLDLTAKNEPFEANFKTVAEIAASDAWVAEGSYLGWTTPLLERATVIVLIEVPWRVASYRILTRHFKRSLTGNNRYPGLCRLYRFWRWSARYYGNVNNSGLDAYGVPGTHVSRVQLLQQYAEKLVICRTKTEIEQLMTDVGPRGGSV